MPFNIVTIDDEDHSVLTTPAQSIEFPLSQEVETFLDELKLFIESMTSPYGVPAGLAATQVGVPWRIIYINIPEEAKQRRKDVQDVIPLTALINPSYKGIESSGKSKDWEACYSVPGRMGEVWRYQSIYLEAMTRDGKSIAREAHGFLARLLQHEIGHLNGEVYTSLIGDDCRFGSMEEMMPIREAELEESQS